MNKKDWDVYDLEWIYDNDSIWSIFYNNSWEYIDEDGLNASAKDNALYDLCRLMFVLTKHG